ncbi:hypothetical protein CSW58_09825 [Caulobacter sp. B11]|uniref:hypothetical protein n=1 Tax=Caulobacter sp. B11 TaxID=2048899 RepID=UPI000C12A8EF|nr:hypothetical protein [Caulobacter sp. B11]PHY12852.1 hypothetical protein CSW58_09825 [Caulobacter sp. B11]
MTKTPTQADENRICLLNEVPAARVKTALTNTKARLELIERETAAAHQRAMSPTADDAEIRAARAEVTDLAFERERLANAVEHLTERHTSLAAAEVRASQQEEHSLAKAERDALVVEIAEVYPKLAEQLIDLFTRLDANDARLSAVNKAGGGERLESAEVAARGCAGNFIWPVGRGAGNVARLTRIQLPNLNQHGYAWPPRTSGREREEFRRGGHGASRGRRPPSARVGVRTA